MTENEKIIALALGVCRYLPASFEKRFARDLSAIAKNNPDYELSERQKEQLYNQLKSYRGQIPKIYEKYYPIDRLSGKDNQQTKMKF